MPLSQQLNVSLPFPFVLAKSIFPANNSEVKCSEKQYPDHKLL